MTRIFTGKVRGGLLNPSGHKEMLPRKSGICKILAEARTGISRREGRGEDVLSRIIMFTSPSSFRRSLRLPSISHSGKIVVWRSLSTFSKFPELAGGRARISTFLNPKPTTLITSLCYLHPGLTQMIIVAPQYPLGLVSGPPQIPNNPRILKSHI